MTSIATPSRHGVSTPIQDRIEERRVRGAALDDHGDIVALCNPYAHWQRITRWVAMREIEEGRCRYYVQRNGSGDKVYLTVEEGRLRIGELGEPGIDPDELAGCEDCTG